eukprot:CAMPEP_0119015198 /NCGR_PEP_ID=MMETSP1176-20130426/10608_1 /TAXON_ID=265551 /ORGANISM="Synedropsis recta cf, Strain CCMP1620" /LENGTH=242 /DNA_ID=CAMNT_0006968469 /DNA_START=91 /DNA_END=819 /DNA_ORIENTATION=+
MEVGYTASFEEETVSLAVGSKHSAQEMAGYEDNNNNDHDDGGDANDNKRLFPSTPHPFSKKMRVKDNTPTTSLSSYDADAEPSPNINALETLDGSKTTNAAQDDSPPEDVVDDEEDEEPDWDNLGATDPNAQAQIDLFLKAREMRDQADDSFSHTMDDCHNRLEATKKAILQAVANVHNLHRTELDYLEADIKSTLLWNHKARTEMTAQLEETRNRAQGLFQQLLMNVGGGVLANNTTTNTV